MGIQRDGQDPQGYVGINPIQNPKTVLSNRAPGTADRRYKLGTPWINRDAGSVYFLTNVATGAANWAIASPGASEVDTLTGDSGGPLSPTAGDMILAGGTNITSVGSGSTITFNLDSNPTLAGLLTCNASATINTAGTTLTLAADNSADAVILGGGTSARAITIGQDAAAHTVAIGQAAAGAITIDTAAGVSIDAATASNFTVSAALADLTLESTLGRVIVNAEEAAANAITLLSAAGGVDVDAALAVTIDGSAGISFDAATASNFTVSDAGENLTISSILGSVLVSSGEDTALAIRLHADAGTSETIQIHSDQGTGVSSIDLLSDVGGISLVATGFASADAININAAAGGVDIDGALAVNIASAEAAATAVTISASNAAGGIDLTTGGGSIDLSSAGSVTMVPGTSTAAAATGTVNKNVGVTTHTGLTTASAASQVFTITNSVCTVGSAVFVSASNLGANDAQMTITRVTPASGSFTVTLTNNGAASLNGDVILTWWIIAA